MSITIELPEGLEKILQDEATRTGKTPGELASKHLSALYAGIEPEAVEALRTSFTEEGEDLSLEETFAAARARFLERRSA